MDGLAEKGENLKFEKERCAGTAVGAISFETLTSQIALDLWENLRHVITTFIMISLYKSPDPRSPPPPPQTLMPSKKRPQLFGRPPALPSKHPQSSNVSPPVLQRVRTKYSSRGRGCPRCLAYKYQICQHIDPNCFLRFHFVKTSRLSRQAVYNISGHRPTSA